MNPQVAIVIVNWNGWRDTVACVESCRRLDYHPCSVVLVDNGSSDESVEMFRRLLPDVSLIETGRNLGFGGGCNVGAARAVELGAEYLWFLNNDAVADAGALGEMVAVARTDDSVGAVGSVIHPVGRTEVVEASGGGRVRMMLGIERHLSRVPPERPLDWITGTSLLVRSNAFRDAGGFDESFFMYWEDTDLGFRLRDAGWRLAVAERSVVWHKGGGSLDRRNPRGVAYFNGSAVRFFRKHSSVPLIPIVAGVSGRAIKQMARGRFDCGRAAVRGAVDALRRPVPR